MTRAGFVAVIGAPNSGKSTLVNALVGQKVSIVTHKVQTTRFAVRGVAMLDQSQMVLVDTPGIFTPRRRLDRAMVRAAWGSLEGADAVVHLVDARAQAAAAGSPNAADRLAARDVATIVEGLQGAKRKPMLALNKVDTLKRELLLGVAEALFARGVHSEAFMISALTGSGLGDLKARLAEQMPAGPWLYPAEQSADLPLRLLASEITREKIYLRVHEELPYQAGVETTAFEERTDGSVRIEQTVFVEREGQRGIVLGKGGQTLKWIGESSRAELARLIEKPVHLFLHVKVKETWAQDRALYRELGLDFDV
ncbi:MAG: GTPase Era [Caulobacteraceae bacterium]